MNIFNETNEKLLEQISTLTEHEKELLLEFIAIVKRGRAVEVF